MGWNLDSWDFSRSANAGTWQWKRDGCCIFIYILYILCVLILFSCVVSESCFVEFVDSVVSPACCGFFVDKEANQNSAHWTSWDFNDLGQKSTW